EGGEKGDLRARDQAAQQVPAQLIRTEEELDRAAFHPERRPQGGAEIRRVRRMRREQAAGQGGYHENGAAKECARRRPVLQAVAPVPQVSSGLADGASVFGHAHSLTLGSRIMHNMSTARFISMKDNAIISTAAWMTGKSRVRIASTTVCPRPGHANTRS